MVKLGLGQPYSKVIIPNKVRGIADLTKPASSLGAGGMFFFGSLFFFVYTDQQAAIVESLPVIFWATLAVVFSHGASQSMNMAEDAEIDSNTEHKQDRPIPSGVVSEEEARSVSWILIGSSITAAYMTKLTFGVFITVLCFFGVFYNLDPIRAKERIISIPWQAVSRGLLPFPAIWAAYGDPLSMTPWVLGIFMFWYVMGFQNSADIIDKDVDAEYGIRTFVVVYGVDGTLRIATGCTVLMILTILAGVGWGLLPFSLLSMLGIIPFCVAMLFYITEYPGSVSGATGNHPAWLWYYIGLVLSVIIPLATEAIYYSGGLNFWNTLLVVCQHGLLLPTGIVTKRNKE